MSQVLRSWTFWIHATIEEECRRDIEKMVLSRMRLAPGNQRAIALFNKACDGTVEVVVLSVWSSLEDIKAHVGPDYDQPTIPPSHMGKVIDKEPSVHHYAMNEIPSPYLSLSLS